MKNLIIIPFLIVGLASAQTNSDPFISQNNNIDNEFLNRIMSIEIPRKDFAFDLSSFDKVSSEFQSNFRVITPNEFMLTNYPTRDLADMSDLFMGSALSQSFMIGNKKFIQTYVFDINGTLRSSQFSFSFGKDK